MLFIRSLLFHICFFVWTAIWAILLVWTYLIPRRAMVWVITQFFRSYIPFERYIVGLDYEVRGMEHMPAGPCIIAMKHQSTYETLKLHHLFGDVAIILKRELMYIPFWGWYQAKSGVIPVDRGAKGVAMTSMLRGARKVVAEGRRIVIFPQGTRIKAGARHPYKSGVGVMYEDLGLPLVPVAINAGVFWPRRSFYIHPGKVTFEILPPIQPGLPREQVMKQLEEAIETASDRLIQQAGGPALGSVD